MDTSPTTQLRRLPVGAQGPEDVAVLDDRLVTGVADGRVLSMALDGTDVKVLADTGGRPLGIELFPDGRLVVCDGRLGLLRVDPHTGVVEPLVGMVAGEPMKFCNNAAVTADGTIFFSDSSRRHGLDGYQRDLVERTASGRLLRRDAAGEVQVLLDNLEFANGVALADDESFVAVAETGAARIRRVWLTGPRCGESEVLAEDLAGMPDNLSTGSEGRIWIAVPAPMLRSLRAAQRGPRVARKLIGRVASAVDRAPSKARVLAVDRDGDIVGQIDCTRGCRYRMVTGVREHAGTLYLGSLTEDAIAAVSPVPSVPTAQIIDVETD